MPARPSRPRAIRRRRNTPVTPIVHNGRMSRLLPKRVNGRFLTAVSLCIALGAAPADASPVQGIRPMTIDPIAVRGGVIMIPLTAQFPGSNWPTSLRLTLSDGSELIGTVAWLSAATPSRDRHWTGDPRNLSVRVIEPSDDSSKPQTGSPILLARLPSDGAGAMQLAGTVLRPRWIDPAAPPDIVDPELRRLSVRQAADLPDSDAPLEHWRWIVMADSLAMTAPGTERFDQTSAMLAEQQAALWRIGLARLRRIDERLTDRCVQMLISHGFDRDLRFATWVADPVTLDALLNILLQPDRADRLLRAEVESWLESQRPVLMWPVSLYGQQVELALVNRLSRAVSVELTWERAAAPTERLRLAPGVLSRLVLDRPQSPSRGLGLPTLDSPTPVVLRVSVGTLDVGSLTFPPEEITARPPGVFISTLFPPLTLADVERARQSPVEQAQTTTVHIRRLGRRWEVFFECRRPLPDNVNRPVSLQDITTLNDLRGIEAVTLLIGRDQLTNDSPLVLSIPEQGWWRLLRGRQDGALQIHRRSFDDRWNCRVVLPESWLNAPLTDQVLLLGLLRSHAVSMTLETGPNRCVPWRIQPGQLRVDLSQWDDLPRFDGASAEPFQQ